MKYVILPILLVFAFTGCPADRYSVNPESARIQALTDFCIGYGALRDAVTVQLKIDTARATPVISNSLRNNYKQAREFIKPYCSTTFDPQSDTFSLASLEDQLVNLRIILLQREAL